MSEALDPTVSTALVARMLHGWAEPFDKPKDIDGMNCWAIPSACIESTMFNTPELLIRVARATFDLITVQLDAAYLTSSFVATHKILGYQYAAVSCGDAFEQTGIPTGVAINARLFVIPK